MTVTSPAPASEPVHTPASGQSGSDPASARSAGHAIVEALALHGVERVFAVPGESYLDLLDGLHDSDITTVVCRHEGGAAYMAEAHGKLTGEPGVAMVTRGPGAANAYVAIHAAWQDATPMVLFVGLVPSDHRDREAFQDFDPRAWFGTQAKRVLLLDQPERASELVAEAFFAARSGRPGPVVVGLPEDVITRPAPPEIHPVLPVTDGGVAPAELGALRELLIRAERPLILTGGARWTPRAAARLTAFAERHRIPVAQDWRASDRVPFDSPVNIGQLGYGRRDSLARRVEEADLLLCVGGVLSDVPSDGYTLRQSPTAVTVVANIDATLRGRSGGLTRQILAAPDTFTEALTGLDLTGHPDWTRWTAEARDEEARHSALPAEVRTGAGLPATAPGTAHMTTVVAELVERLPDDAVYTFGAGNHCVWAQRYLPTRVFPSQLSMRNGSMGYSVPAALATSLESPDRLTVAVAGDGEFLMNGQEIATAVQHGAAFLVILMDNQQYGTIREHQEHHYPGRISGTQLTNPDFAAYARAFGAHGETVTSDDQAAGAVERALKAVTDEHRPAVIHVVVDQNIPLP
ncbi:thiamine pyrophosphate-dependent enzyme [Streptomyces sp. NPDC088141]|uniref:thiamine pyrophosphate-dependent enzyme n=1 Tax=Streptomyces sp. NPDC088141 TaxID=3155179 RepID=UPI003415C100